VSDNVFPTHAVLSITTGRLMVKEKGVSGVVDVLQYVTGRSIFTHELPRFSGPVADAILAKHPNLPTEATRENYRAVLAMAVKAYGATITLDPSLKNALAGWWPMSPVATAMEALKGRRKKDV